MKDLNASKSGSRQQLVRGAVCLFLTLASLAVMILTHQVEPCPTGVIRGFEQNNLDPLYFGLGISVFSVSVMLAFYFAMEFLNVLRKSDPARQ